MLEASLLAVILYAFYTLAVRIIAAALILLILAAALYMAIKVVEK